MSLRASLPSISNESSYARNFVVRITDGQETGSLPCPTVDFAFILQTVDKTLELHSIAKGATVDLFEGNMAGRDLFAVSVYPDRTVELASPPRWEQLFAFAVANLDLLVRPDRALGTWFDKDRHVHVLDVVMCHADLNVALDLGRESGQFSVFDLANQEEIKVGELARQKVMSKQ